MTGTADLRGTVGWIPSSMSDVGYCVHDPKGFEFRNALGRELAQADIALHVRNTPVGIYVYPDARGYRRTLDDLGGCPVPHPR